MLPNRQAWIQHLEATCRDYRDSIEKGEDWPRIPCELTEHWLSLLRRDDVTASEAAMLVRRCDEHKATQGGIVFFTMCNDIRKWYRDIYEQELRDTI